VGITAGQGTGLEYMVAPWIQYEAYDLQIVDNYIHDVQNAGLAVLGGTDILMTGNVLYNVGLNQDVGAPMLLIGLGTRECDGDVAACEANQALGGWGPTQPGEGGEWIPNNGVTISDNVFLNPPGSGTLYGTITIADPVDPPPDTNIPSPASATVGLVITGNNFWDGGSGHDLGVTDPVLAAQIQANNQVGTVEPPLVPPPLGVGDPSLPPIVWTPPNPTPQPPDPTPQPPDGSSGNHGKSRGHRAAAHHAHLSTPEKSSPHRPTRRPPTGHPRVKHRMADVG
jgi:hypothetical protein